jgi:hypothetical protein
VTFDLEEDELSGEIGISKDHRESLFAFLAVNESDKAKSKIKCSSSEKPKSKI